MSNLANIRWVIHTLYSDIRKLAGSVKSKKPYLYVELRSHYEIPLVSYKNVEVILKN